MCGRTCITLDPKELKCACKYKKVEAETESAPEFRNEYNLGRQYSKKVSKIQGHVFLLSFLFFQIHLTTCHRVKFVQS